MQPSNFLKFLFQTFFSISCIDSVTRNILKITSTLLAVDKLFYLYTLNSYLVQRVLVCWYVCVFGIFTTMLIDKLADKI